MNTIILTDSGSDLPIEFMEENEEYIDYLGMPINIEGNEFIDDFGKTADNGEFYKKLRAGIIPKTSGINFYRFYQKFKEHYDKGNAIIYLGLSSGISGTYNVAVMAREAFVEENKDADITIIDTVSASIGLGVLVVQASYKLKEGFSYQQVIEWVEENKMKVNHWFAVDDLNYLEKGGRIPSAAARVGKVLDVKPILIVNREGKLRPYSAIRGRKKSLKYLANKMLQNKGTNDVELVIIGHGNCLEDAGILENDILEEYKPKKIIVTQLSATIATHVGPNMIAVAFIGEDRAN